MTCVEGGHFTNAASRAANGMRFWPWWDRKGKGPRYVVLVLCPLPEPISPRTEPVYAVTVPRC